MDKSESTNEDNSDDKDESSSKNEESADSKYNDAEDEKKSSKESDESNYAFHPSDDPVGKKTQPKTQATQRAGQISMYHFIR